MVTYYNIIELFKRNIDRNHTAYAMQKYQEKKN